MEQTCGPGSFRTWLADARQYIIMSNNADVFYGLRLPVKCSSNNARYTPEWVRELLLTAKEIEKD